MREKRGEGERGGPAVWNIHGLTKLRGLLGIVLAE